MRRSNAVTILAILPIVFLGCASASRAPQTTETIDVGGYSLWAQRSGSGSPAVVFESGLGDDASWWRSVAPNISRETTTVVYSRAGLGRSSKAPVVPRTSQDMAADLHAVLAALGISGPSILVAHSIGALTARVFAATYPDDVAAIVLVDGSVPDQWLESLAALPPESPSEAAGIGKFRRTMTALWGDPSFNPEHMDIAASASQAKTTVTLGDLPLAIVTRSPTAHSNPMLPPALEQTVEDVWQKLQHDLLDLTSNSFQVIAKKAGHRVPTEEPKLVVEVILRVLAEIRSSSM